MSKSEICPLRHIKTVEKHLSIQVSDKDDNVMGTITFSSLQAGYIYFAIEGKYHNANELKEILWVVEYYDRSLVNYQ